MKTLVMGVVSFALLYNSCQGQRTEVDDLADLISKASKIAGDGWSIEYAYESRRITFTSRDTIRGSDFSGGLPNDAVGDYQIRVSFRLTTKPDEQRKLMFDSMLDERAGFFELMSDNARDWAGGSKQPPQSLTKAEWKEYLKYAELTRQLEMLVLPTHTYKSLHLVDVSNWRIEVANDQTDAGRRLLAEREKLLRLLTFYK